MITRRHTARHTARHTDTHAYDRGAVLVPNTKREMSVLFDVMTSKKANQMMIIKGVNRATITVSAFVSVEFARTKPLVSNTRSVCATWLESSIRLADGRASRPVYKVVRAVAPLTATQSVAILYLFHDWTILTNTLLGLFSFLEGLIQHRDSRVTAIDISFPLVFYSVRLNSVVEARFVQPVSFRRS